LYSPGPFLSQLPTTEGAITEKPNSRGKLGETKIYELDIGGPNKRDTMEVAGGGKEEAVGRHNKNSRG